MSPLRMLSIISEKGDALEFDCATGFDCAPGFDCITVCSSLCVSSFTPSVPSNCGPCDKPLFLGVCEIKRTAFVCVFVAVATISTDTRSCRMRLALSLLQHSK